MNANELLRKYDSLYLKWESSDDAKFRALCSHYMRYIADRYWRLTGRIIL